MRPASNVDKTTYASFEGFVRSRYYSGPWSDWSTTGMSQSLISWERSIYPSTTINPVQPDGRRARSAWSNRFSSTVLVQHNLVSQYKTIWGDEYQYRRTTSAVGTNSIGYCFGNVSGAVSGVFPYEAEARARTQFLKKLADDTASLGVALAEFRQTARMAGDLSRDILTGLDKALKAGKGLKRKVVLEILRFGKIPARRSGEAQRTYNRRVRRERAVVNKWLETQFGLIPLVNDIDQIGKGLSDLLFEQATPMVLTIKSGSEVRESKSFTYDLGSTSVKATARANTLYKCWISADYAIPLSGSRTWNQWGMLNPTAIAWELTQFSWLVDYAFQVGDWLNSLTASTGTVPLGGSLSRLAQLQDSSVEFVDGTYKVLQPKGPRRTGLENVGWFQRDLIGEVAPSLRPTVRNKLNLTRLANVLSVLAQRAGK